MVGGWPDRLAYARQVIFAILRGGLVGCAIGFPLAWFMTADKRAEIRRLEAELRIKCEMLIAREAPLTPARARWYTMEAGCPADIVNSADPRMNI